MHDDHLPVLLVLGLFVLVLSCGAIVLLLDWRFPKF